MQLFRKEKAAMHGGGMGQSFVEPLEKQKAWPWAMPLSSSSTPISAFSPEGSLPSRRVQLPQSRSTASFAPGRVSRNSCIASTRFIVPQSQRMIGKLQKNIFSAGPCGVTPSLKKTYVHFEAPLSAQNFPRASLHA
jgi:hypothetical protein